MKELVMKRVLEVLLEFTLAYHVFSSSLWSNIPKPTCQAWRMKPAADQSGNRNRL